MMLINRRIKAFTLVETLLALLVLGIGVVSLFSIFAIGSGSVRRSVYLAEASMAGQMVMEYYCYTGYYPTMAGSGIPQRPQETYNADYSDYWPDSSDIDVTQVVSGTINNLYRVELEVYRNNTQHLADFDTYVVEY